MEMSEIAEKLASERRIKEAVESLRHKDVRSTTLERLRVTWEANEKVRDLPQPLQLGEGLYHILENISVPVVADDLILGRITEEVPDEEGEAFFRRVVEEWRRSIPPWMPDGGHECFAWDRLLTLGLSGLQELAERVLGDHIRTGNEGQIVFLQGAIRVYEALRRYARRYGDAAEQIGLTDAAAVCRNIADKPPETFREALQLMWLVGFVFCTMLSANPTLTFGRMDELLLPFYRRDISLGRMSESEAGYLIEDFYCKNNLILGRGEHQMSGGSETDTGWARNLSYDAPQYVVVAGTRTDGSPPTNELTRIFLERIVPRFENPVIVVRYTSDLPDDIWRLICDRMRANSSMMIYNDHRVIPAMIHAGIDPKDAVTYTMHGCNWPDIPGVQRTFINVSSILPKYFLDSIDSEVRNIDDIYDRFRSKFSADIETSCRHIRDMRAQWKSPGTGMLKIDDCFFRDSIPQARSWSHGAIRYPNIVCAISSFATAADCFAAVDELVFRSGRVTLDELLTALKNDFRGMEPLRQLCLNAPKFGQDDDRADRHAVRLLQMITDEIDKAARIGTDEAVVVFRCLETDMRHINIGSKIGATPDGRSAGKPTSENTSPSPGSCVNGITAMLRSVAKLPLNRINSGALNVRLRKRLVSGDDGLERLMSLLRAYFDEGGLQVQLSVADTDELREAQKHPEEYRDLMVRITGYSAAFVDMSKKAQDEIIRREEMGG